MNTSDTINSALDKLIAGTEHRSASARFRDVYPMVEKALGAGVPTAVILETLKEQGLPMSVSNFRSALYRLRRTRRTTTNSPERVRTSTFTPKSKEPGPEPAPLERTIHSPEDLRRARDEPVNLDDYLK